MHKKCFIFVKTNVRVRVVHSRTNSMGKCGIPACEGHRGIFEKCLQLQKQKFMRNLDDSDTLMSTKSLNFLTIITSNTPAVSLIISFSLLEFKAHLNRDNTTNKLNRHNKSPSTRKFLSLARIDYQR